MGRPSDLTPTLSKRFCELIAKGMWLKAAAAACNVNEQTVHQWIRRGRAGENPYAHFVDDLEVANAAVEQACLERIGAAAKKPQHWGAAAWLLERRFPARYGHTVKVEAQVKSGIRDALVKLKASLNEEEFASVLAVLADEGAGEGIPD